MTNLVSIQCKGDCKGIHEFLGNAILESRIFILYLTSLLDIPRLTENNIGHFGDRSFENITTMKSSSIHSMSNSSLDAIGLCNSVAIYSKHNLVDRHMQDKEHYFVMSGLPVGRIPAYVQYLTFCGNYSIEFNSLTISSNLFNNLRCIVLAASCFTNIQKFVINDLTSLESVDIGKRCFTLDRWKKRCCGSFFRVANCPNLRKLIIGDGSFADYESFQLCDLNSLQSIDFGKETFNYCDFIVQSKYNDIFLL